MNREQAEDLKAFEQRLTECVTHIKGQSRKWRVLLSMLSVCTAAFVINWWMDNSIYETYWDVLAAHKGMVAMIVVLFSFYVFGILDKYTAPQMYPRVWLNPSLLLVTLYLTPTKASRHGAGKSSTTTACRATIMAR
eukprot:Em0018g1203a